MSEVTGKRDELQENIPASNRHEELTQARRRRLLLGAAAIPTVYTLTSGAGVAAASLTCWDRQSTTPTPQRVTSGPDQWARAPMTTGMVNPGNTVPGYCLKDPAKQAECIDPMNPDRSAAGTYWLVQGDRRLEAQGGIWKIPKTSGYGLLYVDRTGTIKAFDPQAHPEAILKFAATSCMNTFSPSTKLTLG